LTPKIDVGWLALTRSMGHSILGPKITIVTEVFVVFPKFLLTND